MEEENYLANLSPEEAAIEKKKKSLNRIFGALLVVGIILFALLFYELIQLII